MTGAVVAAGGGSSLFDVGNVLSTRDTYLTSIRYVFLTSNPSPKAGYITSVDLDFFNANGSFALFTCNGSGVVSRIIGTDIPCAAGLQSYVIPYLQVDAGEYIGIWLTTNTNGIGRGFNAGFQYYSTAATSRPGAGTNLLSGGSNLTGSNVLMLAHGNSGLSAFSMGTTLDLNDAASYAQWYDESVVSPKTGFLTSARTRIGSSGGGGRYFTVSPGSRIVRSVGEAVTLGSGGFQVSTFASPLPIAAGDCLGFWSSTANHNLGVNYTGSGQSLQLYLGLQSTPTVGAALGAPWAVAGSDTQACMSASGVA